MKGPIVWRPAAGSNRRTEKPPRSRGRPAITRSMPEPVMSLEAQHGLALVEDDVDGDVACGKPVEIRLQLRADHTLARGQRPDTGVVAIALQRQDPRRQAVDRLAHRRHVDAVTAG